MVLKLPLNEINNPLICINLYEIYKLFDGVYVCMYSNYICLLNVNYVPFLIKKENIKSNYINNSLSLFIAIGTYILIHKYFPESQKDIWEEIKKGVCLP